MKKETVLKECPFCGCQAKFNEDMRFHEKDDSFPKWYIYCSGCYIRTPLDVREKLVKKWNNRFKTEMELLMEDDCK